MTQFTSLMHTSGTIPQCQLVYNNLQSSSHDLLKNFDTSGRSTPSAAKYVLQRNISIFQFVICSFLFKQFNSMSMYWGILTHCVLVVPYGDTHLDQHWLRQWLDTWWHQVITWTNIGFILGRELGPSGVSPNQHSRWKLAFSPLKHVQLTPL